MGPDLLEPSYDGGGDGSEEVADVAIGAYGDVAQVFESTEHALDDVTLLERALIAGALDAAVTVWRNDGVELGVAATSREASSMGKGPAFVPPAQRRTLMHELSMTG